MHLTAAWIALLVAGGLGSLALATVAALLRRDISELQRSMRPLRVRSDRRRDRTL